MGFLSVCVVVMWFYYVVLLCGFIMWFSKNYKMFVRIRDIGRGRLC